MSAADATSTGPERRLAVLGAPVEAGAGQPGALMGPAALRTAGLVAQLQDLGYRVEDHGDAALPHPLPAYPQSAVPAGIRNFAEVVGWAQVLNDRVGALLRNGALPIVLGGDHSLSMGSIQAVARHCRAIDRQLFILWLDAHADFNTTTTSPSGNMHGMPVAALCGEPGFDAIFGSHSQVTVDPANVHLFGIRSIDKGERALLKARGIDVADMRLIDELGVSVLLRRILERVAAVNGVLHVSLDVDFLDPSVAPGVGTATLGGATYREAHLIMEMLYDSGVVGSLDVVELNPFLDDRGKSARVLVELVSSLFGKRIIDRATPGRQL